MMAKTRRSTAVAMKPASSFSSLSNMSSSSLACFLVLLVSSSVLLSVSDGASVPITTTSASTSPPSTTIKINPSSSGSSSDDDVDILESLASSRILMDHTSSAASSSTKFISRDPTTHSVAVDVMSSENRIEKAEEITTTSSSSLSSSVTTGSTTLLPTTSKVSSFSGDFSSSSSSSIDPTSSYAKKMSSSSPLHVARCRATCLEKFHPGKELTTTTSTTTASSATVQKQAEYEEETSTSADEMHLLPILRLKRRKRFSSSTVSAQSTTASLNGLGLKSKKNLPLSSSWSCLENSPDCLTCWKSCELLESEDERYSTSADDDAAKNKVDGGEILGKDGSEKKQQSILSCFSNKHCTDGCQVACSFYQRLYLNSGENNEDTFSSTATDPVVAMKHERIVKIAPGKITWPALRNHQQDPTSTPALPLVYVVIQEYPDRKWRQIAQTTETEIDIPTELTSSMNTKLRSVRVLVVGKDGLLAVYNPERSLEQEVGQERKVSRQADNSNNSGKVNRTGPESDTNNVSQKTDVTAAATGEQNAGSGVVESVGTSFSAAVDTANDQLVYANTPVTNTPTPSATVVVVSDSAAVTSDSSDSDKAEEEPFELRVVSLIHQKSLVIAELRWDEIGGNPNQDYLITWELTGGGLKGHLVTDSTSVTLSLWPDTTYQIQVEKFQQNLDGDGDQTAAAEVVSPAEKSLPLTVDTSEASFPMEQPSALLGNGDIDDEDSEDDYEDEDVSVREGKLSVALGMGVELHPQQQNSRMVQNPAAHKSMTTGGFLNMTLLIGIAISALLFVLVILTVAAFTWTRMRAVSASPYNGHRHHHHHHRRASSPSSFDYCSSSPMITPTKNPSRFEENCDRNGGECCYDCEEGDIIGAVDGGRCFSDNSEPQPLLYCREDEYSWDDCHHHNHHHHRSHHQKDLLYSPSSYYSMGLNYYQNSKDDANSILHHCSFETSSQNRKGNESSGVAVISGNSNLTMPLVSSVYPGSSSYLGYCRNGGSDNIAYSLLSDSSLRTTTNCKQGQQSRH